MNQDPKPRPVFLTQADYRGLSFLFGQGLDLIPKADHGMLLPELALDEKRIVDHIRCGMLPILAEKGIALPVKEIGHVMGCQVGL